jgi:hypothetical protein
MTDTFAGGFVVAIIAVLLAAAVVGYMHCHSLGFFTACF